MESRQLFYLLTKLVADRRRSRGAVNDWSCNLLDCPSCSHTGRRIIPRSKAIRWGLTHVKRGDMVYLHTSHTLGSNTCLPGKSHETRRGISRPKKDATVRCADISKRSDVLNARDLSLMKQDLHESTKTTFDSYEIILEPGKRE